MLSKAKPPKTGVSLAVMKVYDQSVGAMFYSILTGVAANEEKRQAMVKKGLWKTGTKKVKIHAPKTHMRKRQLECRRNNGPSDMSKLERMDAVASLSDEVEIDEMLKADTELVEPEVRVQCNVATPLAA